MDIDLCQFKYSPSECIGTKVHAMSGDPDANHISASFVEANLIDRVLTFEDIVAIMETVIEKPGPRGAYRKSDMSIEHIPLDRLLAVAIAEDLLFTPEEFSHLKSMR